MNIRAWVAAIALCACGSSAADFSFALLGDTPYSQDEEERVAAMLYRIGLEDMAFIVHVGDFKNGWSSCGDAVYARRKELFAASRRALVYLPGDNDWTDCSRTAAGRYSPLERLNRLRQMFFGTNSSLGKEPIALERQSALTPNHRYPEHVRWTQRKVVFAGFNMPGPDNNLARMPDEHRARDDAARNWLKQAFALARREQMAAVVVLMHANPLTDELRARSGFARFLELLVEETVAFEGEVLLVHGDTHHYRVDQPFVDPRTKLKLARLIRVEVFGSPWLGWVRVRARETAGSVKFEIEPGG